ncbi:hypothetical protein PCI56_15060 [Plesiomonas shigelloides subsp. oncorhynchi]|nr:hypothetical protein [Plesiomonas shigelloides]
MALLWLPAGIGLLMYCRYGKRALPWIFCASFAVNGYYSLLSTDQQILYLQFNVQDIGSLSEGLTELGNSLVSSILASLIDCFEAWLGFRIWRIQAKSGRAGANRCCCVLRGCAAQCLLSVPRYKA